MRRRRRLLLLLLGYVGGLIVAMGEDVLDWAGGRRARAVMVGAVVVLRGRAGWGACGGGGAVGRPRPGRLGSGDGGVGLGSWRRGGMGRRVGAGGECCGHFEGSVVGRQLAFGEGGGGGEAVDSKLNALFAHAAADALGVWKSRTGVKLGGGDRQRRPALFFFYGEEEGGGERGARPLLLFRQVS